MDIWFQYGAIVTGLVIAALGPYVPNSGVLSKRMYYAAIVGLGIFSCVIAYFQSKESESFRSAAQTQQESMQQKLDVSEEGHEFLKDQLQASLKQQETSLRQQEISVTQQQVLQGQYRDLGDQVGGVQEQNRGLRDQVRVPQDQNRDLDAQLIAIRKRFAIPADFQRDVSEQLGIQTGVSVTVGKGPAQGEKEPQPK